MKLPMAIVFGLILLCIASYEAEGKSPKLAKLTKDLDLEMQLKILNKPPIKSFQGKNVDIIDCIDIYKQPAFDNPLLKNHKLQMGPNYLSEGIKLRGKYSSKSTTQSESKFPGCPFGTVPFKRTSKEDLIRAKTALDLVHPKSNINSTSTNLLPRTHHAIVTTLDGDPSLKFYGARTYMSIFNLSAQVVDKQISKAMLWLGSGFDNPYNTIEFGWTSNPQLYGDSQPRTYSLWTGDGFEKTGCYNALCPGYVQVSPKVILGDVISSVSFPGKQILAMCFTLFKDPKTSNWWLMVNLGGTQNEAIGYWPKELFRDMSDSAKLVQLGGKVYTPAEGLGHLVPMGSGAYVARDMSKTCSAFAIEFMDPQSKFYQPKDHIPMEVLTDVPKLYQADYIGDLKEVPELGSILLFGGPIGNNLGLM